MKKLATVLLLALAVGCRKEVPNTAATTAPAKTAPAPAKTSAPSGPAIVLSSAIPGDAQFGALPPNATNFQKLLAIQGDFDIYSWNAFIALNWPPGPDGKGDPKKTIGQNGDNDTVWE